MRHIDIGSQSIFANLLAAAVPVTFLDYRPLSVSMNGLTRLGGDILALPFLDASVDSLSCLHVVEHIGLGRYGDPLNPLGTHAACSELQRILAPGGTLYLALPVGKPRTYFNAHRVYDPRRIVDYFSDLIMTEHSGVHDSGEYVEKVGLGEFSRNEYACGMFRFSRPPFGR
jgi:SAM-dependent methyltransferase